MNDLITSSQSIAAAWRQIQDGYSGHISAYLNWADGRDPASYETVLEYFNMLVRRPLSSE
jgi:hypothetical protein